MVDVKTEKASLTTENNTGSTQLTRPGNFCLAHLSDLHLTSLNNTAISPLLNKRMLGYLSWWRKRRFVHRSEIVEALLEDLKTTRPDHIAVTGDLTHLGLPDEFAEAAQWLSQLGPPDQVTVIPGNHEAYVGQDWADQLSVWAAYLKSDNERENRHKTGFFPSLRIRGPIALLGLCSARPSLPFLAVGSLDQKQLDTFAKLLQTTGDAGLLRVILVHHPPVPGSIKWRKRLDNSSALTELIGRYGAELVLHGHTHAPTYTEVRTPVGNIPVVGAPSASELNPHARRCASYNLYMLKQNGENRQLTMRVRSYSEKSGRFEEDQATSLVLPRT